MSFLAPSLLFGVSAAAVPVIIHLLNRRRFRRVPWAAMEFLLEAATARARRLRIEELVLLALRTAAVLLLAMALSRPLFSGGAPSGGDAIILVDTSASMQYTEGAGSLFDFAKGAVRQIIAALGLDARVAVATFDSEVRFPSGAVPLAQAALREDVLSSLEAGWSGTDYARALAEAARVSKGFPSQAPAVFLISDFRLPRQARPATKRTRGPLYLVPVASEDGVNLAVREVAPSGEAFTASGRQLDVTVANFTAEETVVPVSATVDGEPSGASSVSITPAAEATAVAEADALLGPGAHLVEVKLPPDAYTGDDTFRTVIRRRPPRLYLSLSEDSPKYISAALSSAPEGSFETMETFSPTPPDGGAEGFIFAGRFPAGAAAEEVWDRVRQGAFAVVFTGANPDAAAAFLHASGAAAFAEKALRSLPLSGSHGLSLAGEHPVTQFIREAPELSLASVSASGLLDIDVPRTRTAETAIVALTPQGEKAFLMFVQLGKGKAAVFNTSCGRSGGDLVISPFFVPLLFETIAHMVEPAASPGHATCGEGVLVRRPGGAATAVVEGPAGEIEAQLVATPDGFAYSFTPEAPGFYQLAGATIAVNAPPAESEVRLADFDWLESAFGGEVIMPESGFTAAVERGMKGREISGRLVVAALCLLAAEMALVYLLKRGA